MNTETVLEVSHLHKCYAGRSVLSDFSLVLRRGERVAVSAPSGAGKTTLVRILSGLESADGGGFRLNESAPVTIFQEPRLFPFLTVEENIFLPFQACGRPVTPDVKCLYERWLAVCELRAFKRHFPHQLSGGMKQKVALIRGMLGSPRFVMMDEPFQSINAEAKREIIRFILQNHPGLTLLFITHVADEIPLLTQRVVRLEENGSAGFLKKPCPHFPPVAKPGTRAFI